MRPSQLEAVLDDFFLSLSASEQEEFQRKVGIAWEKGRWHEKAAAVKAYVKLTEVEQKHRREDQLLQRQFKHEYEMQERDHDLARELQEKHWEAAAILEKKRFEANLRLAEYNNRQVQQMLDSLAHYIVGGIQSSLENLPKAFAELATKVLKEAKEQKLLPSGGGTINRVADAAHCRLADGPDNIVYTYQTDKGVYQHCMIGYAAHDNRSVLGIQMINHDVLKQGGCPLYRSTDIGHQLLGGISPGFTSDKCELADGRAHELRGLPS